MSIDKNIELNIYKTVDFFLKCINEKDKDSLLSDFEVTLKMYQELEDVLNNYFDGDYKLSLIPFGEIHLQEVENMPIFELDEMDDGEYVLECAVYNYEKDTSLILQGNVDLTNGNVHFFDPLFKS
ncbi:hypothetical protein ACEQ85_00340 [Acinetobacter pittii]|uniref:hypothetical protein n=1 Tax=Acinetobacter pittii TaxID=48296 RepID=UPI0035A36811